MTKHIEDRMELLSAGATDGKEYLLEEWREGTYECARCHHKLYESVAKWRGPCPWPSFRKAAAVRSLGAREFQSCHSYTVLHHKSTRTQQLTGSNRGSNTGTRG